MFIDKLEGVKDYNILIYLTKSQISVIKGQVNVYGQTRMTDYITLSYLTINQIHVKGQAIVYGYVHE